MNPLDPTTNLDRFSRRTLVAGAGGLAGAALLAACGGDGSAPAEAPEGEASEGSAEGSSSSSAEPIARVSDVPVGGAVVAVAAGKPVIVTQPTQGEIVVMSAICTHMGCEVRPEGEMVKCPCHGSTFDLTGGNTGGPADRPLPKVDVTVQGDDINLA